MLNACVLKLLVSSVTVNCVDTVEDHQCCVATYSARPISLASYNVIIL